MGATLGPVQPEIHIGPLTLQSFGICFAVGFIACGAVAARRLPEIGKPRDWAYESSFASLVGGLVGARIDYVSENWSTAKHDLLGSLFALYLVLSGTERVLVEIIRRNHAVVAGLTVPQLFSLALVAAGVAWLVQAQKPLLRAIS